MEEYVASCLRRQIEYRANTFLDVFIWAISHCKNEDVEIYRRSLVARLTWKEVKALAEILPSQTQTENKQETIVIKDSEEIEEETISVIFDQMYKGFADIVAREINSRNICFHEIVGRGLDRPIRQGRIYRQPARDDYDIIRLIEQLTEKGLVILFTGDKKLANQASMLDNVIVEYIPPGEFTGKEMALRYMVEKIQEYLGRKEQEEQHQRRGRGKG